MNTQLKNTLQLLAVCFGLAVSAAWGESITFEELAQEAFDNSLLVRELEAEVAEQNAEALQIRTRQNPELSAEVRPFVSGGDGKDTEYEISIAQPLRLSGFRHRERVSLLMEEVSGIDKKIKLQEFSQKLLLSYGKAWALSQGVIFIGKAAERSKALYGKVKDGASKGVVSASTEQLLIAEVKKLESEITGLRADRDKAFAELVKLSGVSLKDRLLQQPRFPEISKSEIESGADIPFKNRIDLRRKLSAAQREVARLDSFPQFSPRVGFEHSDDGDDRILAGISIELPFWERNQAERMRAEADSTFREAEFSYYAGDRFREETQMLLNSVRATYSQAQSYADEILPALQRALSASERELEAGQGSAFQILQIQQELRAAQDRYIELWIKALSERVELSIFLGKQI